MFGNDLALEKIRISRIENIQFLNIYNLLDKHAKGMFGIFVMCEIQGKPETFNYCQKDELFPYFYETVRRVYKEENSIKRSDNILEEPNRIIIDLESKKLMDYDYFGKVLVLDELKKEIGFTKFDYKLISYKTKEIEPYFNIIKYILEEVSNFMHKNIFIKDIKGIGKSFVYTYSEEDINKRGLFTLETQNEEKSVFVFPGIVNGKELVLEITFNGNIEIFYHDRDYGLSGRQMVDTSSNLLKIISEVVVDNNLVYRSVEELKHSQTYQGFLTGESDTYELPWNDKLCISTKSSVHDSLKEIEKVINYITEYNNHLSIFKEKKVYIGREKENFNLTAIDEREVTNYYLVGEEDYYLVKETTYLPRLLARGIYKSELSGRSFYKVYKLRNKNLELGSNILEELEVSEEVKAYELLRENELKLKLKRSEK